MSKPSGAIDMTQGKPINLMLRFALPMMIGSIFQSLYSMVDSAVLGRFVGSHALAAIGATKSTYRELTQALLDLGVPESDLGEILID